MPDLEYHEGVVDVRHNLEYSEEERKLSPRRSDADTLRGINIS